MTRTLGALARKLENENIAQAYDMGRDMERAAVVAYVRGLRAVAISDLVAAAIERGEHRREEGA